MKYIVCSDFESVLIPETWVSIAEKTGINELKLTTRDISDFDELMEHRLKYINQNNLNLKELQDYISTEEPFEGSVNFVNWIQEKTQFFILSGIFNEFAIPFLEKLNSPKIFCNQLTINENGAITGYEIKKSNNKSLIVKHLQSQGNKVIAFGDSYNDLDMINTADVGFLYNPSEKIQKEYSCC